MHVRMAQGCGSGLRLREVRRLFRSLLFCSLFSFLSLTACRHSEGPAPTVSVREEIDPQPPVVGPATVTVSLSDASDAPLTNARLTVEGDMTHAGMSPVFAEAKEVEPGRYEAHIDFTMAGDWALLLHIRLPDGQMIERQIDVKGVRDK